MGAPSFFGRVVVREHSAHGARTIVEHARVRPLPAHDHHHAYFCLLARGGYEETAGRRLEYRPGSVIFHPPALHHRDAITAPDTRLVLADVDAARLDELRDLRRGAARDVIRCAPPAGLLMTALEARLAARATRAANGNNADSAASRVGHTDADNHSDSDEDSNSDDLVFELLGVLAGARIERTPGAWLSRAEDLMADELHRSLRVTEIAARVGVHPVRLARAVRRRYRCSVSDHLHAIRLERACRLLRETNRPLADIAAALGYADQSHFTRTFSTRLGLSPARFRTAVR